jgi:putative membrane protein
VVVAVAVAALAGTAGCGGGGGTQAASASAPLVSAADHRWLNEAHQADLAEIAAGGQAEARGTTPAIRAAGAMLVRDHSAFDATLVRAAARLKVSVATHQTIHQTEIGDRLASENGAGFDHDFTASMMTAHEHLIGATIGELRHGSDPQVIALAQRALPVLRRHLAMMRALAGTG